MNKQLERIARKILKDEDTAIVTFEQVYKVLQNETLQLGKIDYISHDSLVVMEDVAAFHTMREESIAKEFGTEIQRQRLWRLTNQEERRAEKITYEVLVVKP